jgi:uncharacterized repeat protein (TIGR01451 family)
MRILQTLGRLRRRQRSRGQSLVEFALVVPILLLIFAGAADLGRVFYTYVAVENAAKEGVLYGSRYPLCDTASTLCPNPGNAEYRARQETVNVIDTADLTVAVRCLSRVGAVVHTDLRNCAPGDRYEVTTTTDFHLITPLLGELMGGDFTLSNTATADVLNLAFDPTPGVGPTKLVSVVGARNEAEIRAECIEPDPTGSAGYFRSPCLNESTGLQYPIKFATGDIISYKILARNNGGTNLTGITMDDSLGWPASCPAPPTSMPVGGTTYECTYTRTAPTTGGSAEIDYENIFTVEGNEILATTDGATITIERPPAELSVSKVVSVYLLGGTGDGPFGTADTIAVTYNTVSSTRTASVWFKVAVTNTGGQPATGLSVTDTSGSLPTGTTNCPSVPSTLAPLSSWICYFQRDYTTAQVTTPTVTATATNVTPNANHSDSAQVTVTQCTGSSNRVVPNLVGLVKGPAASAWTAAGFTGTLTTWSGSTSSTVKTQNRQAYGCVAQTSTMAVTR